MPDGEVRAPIVTQGAQDMPGETLRDDLPSAAEGPGDSPRGQSPGRLEDPRAVLDTLPAVIGYYGVDLRNRLANRAYLEFFGLAPDEVPAVTSAR